MPAYATPKLEFSPDALSDTTPTYSDVTAYLIDASWSSGKARDLDEPQAGQAVFVLKNLHRDFEPEYAAGRFYPNILPLRRFRWSITADGVSYPQGTWYATSYQVEYPAGTTYSTVTVTCVDGFGLLALAPLLTLDPPTAETYEEVVAYDDPYAYYPLAEQFGRKMRATVGPEGQYVHEVDHVSPNPITGSNDLAAYFPGVPSPLSYGRAPMPDVDEFLDAGAFSIECVANVPGGAVRPLAAGPWVPADGVEAFSLNNGFALIRINPIGGARTVTASGSNLAGPHHHAATWDGTTLSYYQDGVLVDAQPAADMLQASGGSGSVYVGTPGNGASFGSDLFLAGVAFYNYALTPERVAAHAAAAITLGYPQQTAGSRVAALAANALWSTASIPAGQITVAARMQTGQNVLEEILAAVKAETPHGLFYFDDSGNPAYDPFEYDTTLRATLGDLSNEVNYEALELVYDDEVFNQSTASREGGAAQTAQDATSIAAYQTRSQDETDLIVTLDSDALLIAQTIVDRFGNPMFRIDAVSLNGAGQSERTHILAREIGDVVRVKRRGEGGVAIDIVTRILGKSKHLGADRHLTCTWSLARGFSAASAVWRLGQQGFSELGQTTTLG